jgi:hypothetical protein
LVEPPGEVAGNARAAARVAEPDVTKRTRSMATITFLIVDVEVVDDISGVTVFSLPLARSRSTSRFSFFSFSEAIQWSYQVGLAGSSVLYL